MEDRNSMYNLEARVPFLDYNTKYVFKNNYFEFMKNGDNKSMLRRSMKSLYLNQLLKESLNP